MVTLHYVLESHPLHGLYSHHTHVCAVVVDRTSFCPPPRRKWSHLNVTLREIDFDEKIKAAPSRHQREKLEARKEEVRAQPEGRSRMKIFENCLGGADSACV